jgi:hypothetical protein
MTVLLHTIGLNEDKVYNFTIHYTTEDSKSTEIATVYIHFGLKLFANKYANPGVGAHRMRPDWACALFGRTAVRPYDSDIFPPKQ